MSSTNPAVSADLLSRSYQHCEYVAKTQARNFYFSFLTLPPERKAAMCAIYAFMRYSDDVSDEAAEDKSKESEMREWRAALDRAFSGDYGDNLILPAFHDTMQKYHIPARYFHELIDGTEMDLTQTRYETWDELRQYCYRVASLVGFVCLHVWGFDEANGKALEYAEACGLAFQLTNILRDVKEDAERGRIYLPQEDLRRFNVSEAQLIEGFRHTIYRVGPRSSAADARRDEEKINSRLRDLLKFETERAEAYYRQAQELFPLVHKPGRATLEIMLKIYHGILDAIIQNNYDVYSRRARVSAPKKLGIVASAWFGSKTGRSVK